MFGNRTDGEVHRVYYVPKVEINDYNVVTDGKILFD